MKNKLPVEFKRSEWEHIFKAFIALIAHARSIIYFPTRPHDNKVVLFQFHVQHIFKAFIAPAPRPIIYSPSRISIPR